MLTLRARIGVIAIAIAMPGMIGLAATATAATSSGSQSRGAAAASARAGQGSDGYTHSPQVERMLAGHHGQRPVLRRAAMADRAAALPVGASAVQGVDVASFQHGGGPISWTQVAAAGYQFAFVKIAQGNGYVNPYGAGDLAAASAAGLYVAPYDFAIPNSSGGALQADLALDHAGLAGGSEALPMILDIEYDPNLSDPNTCYGLSPAQLVSWIGAWTAEIVRRTGQRPAIYSTADWWNKCTGKSAAFAADPLWIAGDTGSGTTLQPVMPPAWKKWTYWQYTSTAMVAGIENGSATTDASYLSASALQLLDPPAQSDQAGASVSYKSALTAETVSYSATGLPTGLSISSTGVIFGVLSGGAAAFPVRVTAKPAAGVAVTQAFTWDVHGPVTLRPPGGQTGTVGSPVLLRLTAADSLPGCTLRLTAAGLPAGLTMSSCGVISGWPQQNGQYPVQITATDSAGQTLATTAFGWHILGVRNVGPAGLVRLSRSRCLASGSGARVVVGSCAGARAGPWTVAADATLRLAGRCLALAQPAGPVSLASCSGSAAERWLPGAQGLPGAISPPNEVFNPSTGLCLTDTSARSGARAAVAKCSGGKAQQWVVPAGPLRSGIPGYCLSDYHRRGPVTGQVSVRRCARSAQQTWTIQPAGQVQIGRYCLSPASGAAVAGRQVVLSACRAAASQYWKVVNGPSGAWLINFAASMCLADPGDRARSGTGLVLGYCQLGDPGITWRAS